MSRFGFERCQKCGRLNIHGARCVCDPTKPIDCDCTYTGNEQHIGPRCQQRINDTWSAVIRRHTRGESA